MPHRFRLTAILAVAAGLGLFEQRASAQPQPRSKYGPAAVRLFEARDYIRRHDAPDYWALSPYYLPQPTDSACSAASVAMIVNAARASRALTADDELATAAGVVEKSGSARWKRAVAAGGSGVSLGELPDPIRGSLAAYGMNRARIEAVHVESRSDAAKVALIRTLVESERSGRDFLLVNFLQSAFTGDPEGAVGHIAPIAAYDAERQQVLILDPDRRWYEPYWVSVDTLLAGMATEDPAGGMSRGYLRIELEP